MSRERDLEIERNMLRNTLRDVLARCDRLEQMAKRWQEIPGPAGNCGAAVLAVLEGKP